jgi:hypothetical protein
VFEYRITKYDPDLRRRDGGYLLEEWTSVSDIGRELGGKIVTRAEYDLVESAYVAAALAFLEQAGVETLVVNGLENHEELALPFEEGSVLSLEKAGAVLRQVLREECWCRLVGPEAFIHVGYDYYMYVGVPREVPEAEQLAQRLGLFVEPFDSPHHPKEEDEDEG